MDGCHKKSNWIHHHPAAVAPSLPPKPSGAKEKDKQQPKPEQLTMANAPTHFGTQI
jgi:hypothetical protein